MGLEQLLKDLSASVGETQWHMLIFFRETIQKYGYREMNNLRQHSALIWRVLLDIGSEGYQNIVLDIFNELENLRIEKPINWQQMIMCRFMPYTKEGTEFFLVLIAKEIKKVGYLSEEYNNLNHVEFILKSTLEIEDYMSGIGIFECY